MPLNANVEQIEQLQDLRYSQGFINPSRPASYVGAGGITEAIRREATSRIGMFETNNFTFFKAANSCWRENDNYYMGHQYSPTDLALTLKQGRKPYKFNLIQKFIEQFLSEQRTQRTAMIARPLTELSEQFADVMSHYMQWVCQTNRWDDSHSDIVRDGIVGGWGVAGAWLNPRDPLTAPYVGRQFPLEFMWDVNSATNARLANTNFMWRGGFVSVTDLIDEYPDQKDVIISNIGSLDRNMYAYYTRKEPVVSSTANQPALDYKFSMFNQVYWQDIIFRREFYHRRYEKRWVVRDGVSGTHKTFLPDGNGECPMEAINFAKSVYQFYMNPQIRQMFGIVQPLVTAPFEAEVAYIDRYVFAGSTMIDMKTYESDRYPYVMFIPLYYDGELTSYMESLKDPQRYVNRMFSFLDERAGGPKNGIVVNKRYLDDQQWNDQQIENKFTDTNPVFIVDKDPEDFTLEQFIKPFAPAPPSPQADKLLADSLQFVDRIGGGANLVGSQAFAGQSGKSATVLSQQGSGSHLLIYDKDNFFQEDVGELIMSYAPYIDPTVRMYITDEYDEPIGTSFLSNNIGTIFQASDIKYSVEITETQPSRSRMEQQFQQTMMVMQTVLPGDPLAAQAMMPILLKNSGMPPKDRKQFLQTYQALQQAQSQAAGQQQQFEQQVELQKLQNTQDSTKAKLQVAQIQREPRLNVGLTGDLSQMGPMSKASTFSALGIPATPGVMLQDDALKSTLDLAVQNKYHQEYNKNTPSWEKDKGSRAAKGIQTPKDRMNRSKPKV